MTRCEPNVHHAMTEFANIRNSISFFNMIMRSDLKFVLKDKWAIDLDFNTAILVDSQRNFHIGLELEDQHNTRAEYPFSDEDEDNNSTSKGLYCPSDNNLADNISRNEE